MLPGALTGRLSCGHSETGQTNRRNGNLDGCALNGRSETALNSAVVRSCHSRPAPFRCRFQNARSVLGHHQPQSTAAMLLQMRREMHTFVLSRLRTIVRTMMRTMMPTLLPSIVLGQMPQTVLIVMHIFMLLDLQTFKQSMTPSMPPTFMPRQMLRLALSTCKLPCQSSCPGNCAGS
jgi:hypothetical protein